MKMKRPEVKLYKKKMTRNEMKGTEMKWKRTEMKRNEKKINERNWNEMKMNWNEMKRKWNERKWDEKERNEMRMNLKSKEMDGWTGELLLCWTTSSLRDLFTDIPLLSATSSLSSHLSGLLLPRLCSELPPS
jgi:hypothetical protein